MPWWGSLEAKFFLSQCSTKNNRINSPGELGRRPFDAGQTFKTPLEFNVNFVKKLYSIFSLFLNINFISKLLRLLILTKFTFADGKPGV